jgi:hypothetical protein
MNRAFLVALGIGAVITSAAAIGIGTAGGEAKRAPSPVQYQMGLARIEAARAAGLGRCAARDSAGRGICEAEADGEAMVQAADLEQDYRSSRGAAREAQRARIEARYQVARARCAALGGRQRDDCFISAHAVRGSALLESHGPYESRPG